MLAELIDLLKYPFGQIDFVDEPTDNGFAARRRVTAHIQRSRY